MPTLFDDISDPANYPPGDVSTPGAALEGYLGAVGPRGHMAGLSAASGLPDWLGGFRAPVGWYRMYAGAPGASDAYDAARAAAIARQGAAAEQHPNAYLGGQVAGYGAGMNMGPAGAAIEIGNVGKFRDQLYNPAFPRTQKSSPASSYDEYLPNAPESTNFEDRTQEPWWYAYPALAGSIVAQSPQNVRDVGQYALDVLRGQTGYKPAQMPPAPAGSLAAQAGYNDLSLADILNNATKQ